MRNTGLPFEQIVDRRRQLIRYARRTAGDPDHAEEVVQEPYLSLGEMASRQTLARPGGYLARHALAGILLRQSPMRLARTAFLAVEVAPFAALVAFMYLVWFARLRAWH